MSFYYISRLLLWVNEYYFNFYPILYNFFIILKLLTSQHFNLYLLLCYYVLKVVCSGYVSSLFACEDYDLICNWRLQYHSNIYLLDLSWGFIGICLIDIWLMSSIIDNENILISDNLMISLFTTSHD